MSRLNALRQRAGTPEDHLPSTSTGGDEEAQLLIDRREREKERAERKAKREQKRRDREKLEFDWPKDTRGKEKKREVDPDYERQQWEDKWQTGGHINFWADAENVSDLEAVLTTGRYS